MCAIPQLHPTECFDEPQVRHNQMVIEVDDPVLGRIEGVAPPIRFSGCAQSAGDVPGKRPHADGGGVLAGVNVLDLGAFYAGPFASRLLGAGVSKSNALESLTIAGFVRGLSVRDVEATLAEALGAEAALSKSTVSRVCQAIAELQYDNLLSSSEEEWTMT